MICACAFLLAATVAAPPSPPAKSGDVSQIVRRVQEHYDATADFTAKVEQELVLTSMDKPLRATGTVAFQKPGKMRWVLEDHERQVIVADGKTLWFFQPEEQQVLKAPFEAAFRSTTPISFLTGVGRIDENFDVTGDGDDGQYTYLVLEPKRREGDVGRLRLTVAKGSYDIVVAEIRDPLGNVTRLRFSAIKRNVGLADKLFRFDVPPGVDIIEAPIGY